MADYSKNYRKENIPENYKPLVFKNVKKNMYGINEFGEIWSNYKHSTIKPKRDKDGYLQISLSTDKNKKIHVRIATLVLYNFIGEPPQNMKDPTANHIDSDITNNHYSNLEWLERGRNSSIRSNKGTGTLNHEAKLTEKQVIEICELIKNTNLKFYNIAKMFGVKTSTITKIYSGANWKHITKNLNLKKYRVRYRDSLGRFDYFNPFA